MNISTEEGRLNFQKEIINLGFEKNIFFGIIPFCISLIALIILIGRLIYKRKK